MLRFFKVEDRTLKRHISIGVFVVYIDTGSSVPGVPSKSRDLADENNKNDSKQPYWLEIFRREPLLDRALCKTYICLLRLRILKSFRAYVVGRLGIKKVLASLKGLNYKLSFWWSYVLTNIVNFIGSTYYSYIKRLIKLWYASLTIRVSYHVNAVVLVFVP